MSGIAINNPPVEPRKRASSDSVLLPPLILLAAMFMGTGITVISLLPLKRLQIAYPGWMDYSHFLIPGTCAIVWLMLLRKWPKSGAILAVLLCFTLLPLIPRYAESRIAKVPVTRWIDSNDLTLIETTVGVPVTEQGSREGKFVVVAASNEERVRAELGRLKLLGGAAAD